MRIGVFGCGFMTQSIFEGVSIFPSDFEFSFFTPSQTRAGEMAKTYSGQIVQGPSKDFLQNFDCIFLGFKPQNIHDFFSEFGQTREDTLVVSILAAIPSNFIEKLSGSKKVARLMPSRPIEKQLGITLEYSGEGGQSLAGQKDRALVDLFFKESSLLIRLDSERDFDQLTVVTGSGPGFLFQLAKDISGYMKSEFGFDSNTADQISAQLLVGSSELMKPVLDSKNDTSFENLVKSVASKKGVTQAGLDVMAKKSKGFLAEVFQAGRERVDEMARELKSQI